MKTLPLVPIIVSVLISTLFIIHSFEDDIEDHYVDSAQIMKPIPHTDFCVIADIFRSTGRNHTIPMMLHITPDYIGKALLKTVESWDGRVVLAVYTDSFISHNMHLYPSIEHTLKKLQQLFYCNSHLKEFLTVHIFYLSTQQLDCSSFTINLSEDINCNDHFQLDRINYQKLLGYYPVNAARNIARKFDSSPYFLQADVQQIYSKNAEKILRKVHNSFGYSNTQKVAFIIPRFESEMGSKIPRTVQELKNSYDKSVFQFHAFSYADAHNVTNIHKWLMTCLTTDHLISEITDYEDHNTPVWEPMFSSSSSLPYHNEAIAYGMRNQAALVSLMCCLEYKFVIVNNVFNVHEGVRRIPHTRIVHPAHYVRAKQLITNYYVSLSSQYPRKAITCVSCP